MAGREEKRRDLGQVDLGKELAPGDLLVGVFHAEGAVLDEQSVTYQTSVLPAGKYVVAMTPEGAAPGGDADLYVRVGTAPTATATYDSNERCAVTLTAPARAHMIAKGDRAVLSQYRVDAFQQ